MCVFVWCNALHFKVALYDFTQRTKASRAKHSLRRGAPLGPKMPSLTITANILSVTIDWCYHIYKTFGLDFLYIPTYQIDDVSFRNWKFDLDRNEKEHNDLITLLIVNHY